MIIKRWKGSGRKKKILLMSLMILLPSFLAGALIFSLSGGTIKMPLPIYEEIYSTTNDLHEGIREIDYAIYESLYQSGTLERNIRFSDVQPRHHKGHFWDFVELSVKVQNEHSVHGLQKVLSRTLTELGPEVRLKNENKPDGRVICHVFVRDYYTHRIILGFDSHPIPTKGVRPKVAIIIDDLGYDSDMAFSLIQLDMPLSLSVLPFAPFAELIAQEANREGCEVMLHLPMEPKNHPSVNPGPGALFLSMGEHEIRQVLDRDLREIPGARGVSNHMGSSFTENRDKMLIVLEVLKKRGLFFVDSRTTSDTVGLRMARKIGIPVARRSVFLDNDLAPRAIKIQIERLLSMARHSGSAIGIGHPHQETLEVLKEYHSRLKDEFQFVYVSDLLS